MIIITDLLIIDHLISVSVTSPYLPLVFRYLTSLPYFEQVQFTTHVVSKIADWEANSVDLGSTLFAQATYDKV